VDNPAVVVNGIFSKTQKVTKSATSTRGARSRETVASPVIILTILSIILGAGLGLRLTYPLLVPLVTGGMTVVTLIGFAQGQDAWWFVVAAILVATGLQFGYLAGALALVVAPPERPFPVAQLRASIPKSMSKK